MKLLRVLFCVLLYSCAGINPQQVETPKEEKGIAGYRWLAEESNFYLDIESMTGSLNPKFSGHGIITYPGTYSICEFDLSGDSSGKALTIELDGNNHYSNTIGDRFTEFRVYGINTVTIYKDQTKSYIAENVDCKRMTFNLTQIDQDTFSGTWNTYKIFCSKRNEYGCYATEDWKNTDYAVIFKRLLKLNPNKQTPIL